MCLNKEAGLGMSQMSAEFCLETGEINVSQSAAGWILGNYRDSAVFRIIFDEITSTKVTFSFSFSQKGTESPILVGSQIVLRCCEALQANSQFSTSAAKSVDHCDPLSDHDLQSLQGEKPVETHASFLPVILKVRELVSRLFGRAIDDDDINLAELGMDSIMTTELANSLSQEFSFEFPSTRLVDHPTIRAVIEFTLEKLSVFEAIVKASDRTLGGNLLANCEWFLNYFCPNPK
jgi:acyl carrier protein